MLDITEVIAAITSQPQTSIQPSQPQTSIQPDTFVAVNLVSTKKKMNVMNVYMARVCDYLDHHK